MATYTSRNRLVKQATNENFNSWGDVLNAGGLEMIDEALDGVTALAISGGNVTLTDEDGATDQARKRVLNITSADQARVITVPAVEKFYIVRNASAFTITLTVSGGSSVEVLGGQSAGVFVSGTSIYRVWVDGWGLFATVPEASGTSVTVSLDTPQQPFSDAKIVLDGISIGSGGILRALLRSTSDAGGTAIDLGMNSGSNKFYGTILLPNYRNADGHAEYHGVNVSALTSPTAVVATGLINIVWKIAGGVGDIVFSPNSGNFNNAGSFKVYLR